MVEAVGERAAAAVELLGVELPEVPDEIPWVHFADTGVEDVDLAPADERRLCEEHGVSRGLELCTGGQRLHRYDDYVAALDGYTEPYASYLEAFRHGMPPHGGFAIGLERFVARLVGAQNIRETTLFPRDRSRLAP